MNRAINSISVLVSLAIALCALAVRAQDKTGGAERGSARPNILWISLEDISPDFGCYGDEYAKTPLFDRFAREGVRFTRVFTHAPVCAPSRSGIITGMYPTTIATHHMRCQGIPPPEVRCFSEYLRAAGYYCTNNSKTDYQFDPPFTAWDENGNRAHWRGRAAGQPFFAVFNYTTTHESQIREPSALTKSLVAGLTRDERHDPAKAKLPPYYPDTPKVRRDWANYYDNIAAAQGQVAGILKQLDDEGLADDTIVWIWGDHGRGLPRGKRWIYDSGIHVPLLMRVPEKWRAHASSERPERVQPGAVVDDMIAAIDFGPTVLALAGVSVPTHMQGRPFLGGKRASPRKYVFAGRDRMDERYDVIRAARDERFKYIRNFMPHVPYAQRIAYMDLMPTMQEWRRLAAEKKLDGAQAIFFRDSKPVEELYDTAADPHEVNNLAGDPRHAEKLAELRGELLKWMRETGDLGLVPEPILAERQRPGAKWETSRPPVVFAIEPKQNDSAAVMLVRGTAGASIGYRIRTSGGGAAERGWRLYTQPLVIKKGETVEAKACRIGFRDSPSIEITTASRATPSRVTPNDSDRDPHGQDWRPLVFNEKVLDLLLAVKEHDRAPAKGIAAYQQALSDSHAAVRYWGVVGVRTAVGGDAPADELSAVIAKLAVGDASPVVRVAAAHTLCRWGDDGRMLAILAGYLSDPQPTVQLHAAHALEDLGPQARPFLPKLKQLAAGSSEYVERVSSRIVETLGKEEP